MIMPHGLVLERSRTAVDRTARVRVRESDLGLVGVVERG